jgi:hypothetical protein
MEVCHHVPLELAKLIFDYLPLVDIIHWNVNLPDSFFSSKIRHDYQETLFDSNQVREDNWKTTFQYLYDLEYKKAQSQMISTKDVDWWNSIVKRNQRYTSFATLEVGDIFLVDPGIVLIINKKSNNEFHFQGWSKYKQYSLITICAPIFLLPLQYWSEFVWTPDGLVSRHCTWHFELPPKAQRYDFEYRYQGLSAWVFIHQNVSYALIGNKDYDDVSTKIRALYPCHSLLYPTSKYDFRDTRQHDEWNLFLHAHHLSKDRLFMTFALWKEIIQEEQDENMD